jgi:branched-chain amino acid aminotransferase
MTRMLKSSIRSTLPEFDRDELLKSIKKLISIDSDWIPNSTAASMYVRPTFIGTEPTLGVSSSNTALLYVIMSPIGPYFPTGFKPISLLADTKYVRAFKGGVGNFKVGSNYGPTIYVGIQAQKEKCQQVLWLLGKEEYITEAGTMNIFIVTKNKKGEYEMMTPPLDGTILEGVTRQSVLDLGRKWNDFKVTERQITMKELLEFQDRNELVEMFGAGTACVVCPIDGVLYNGKRHEIKTMTSGGAIMNRISKTINDIQYGKIQSDWGSLVE